MDLAVKVPLGFWLLVGARSALDLKSSHYPGERRVFLAPLEMRGLYHLNPNQAVRDPVAAPARTSKPWFLKSKYRVPAMKMARPSGIYGKGRRNAGGAAGFRCRVVMFNP